MLAGSVGLFVQYAATKRGADGMSATAQSAIAQSVQPAVRTGNWAASAPGRVEPKNGEYRIGTQTPGRVVEIAVQMNDRVLSGDLLARIDDDDAQAKLAGVEAEAAVRKRERDAETVGRLAQDRRTAEDSVANAERALFQVRRDLDRATGGRRGNTTTEDEVARARSSVVATKEKVEAERQALRRMQATAGMPLPTRLESALTTARAELTLAESAVERARIRASSDGTVLQVLTKVGETVAPGPDQALVVLGDLSGLRVRAEVEERDVSKVLAGQKVVIRSDAFPGRDFAGTVTTLGQSLAPPRLASRGPRRPTDLDALEVLIDVDGPVSLMPGMRADVFFTPNATGQSAPSGTVNPAPAAPVTKTN